MIREYVSRARSINCATRRYFYRLFGVFFSFAAISCPRLYGARYSPQICSIVRTWRCCFLIEDPSAPNIGSNASLRIAIERIRFFVAFFLIVFFFLSCPCRSWSWLSSLSRRQQRWLSCSEPNLSRWRVLALYRWASCPPYLSVRSLLQEYVVFSACCVQRIYALVTSG